MLFLAITCTSGNMHDMLGDLIIQYQVIGLRPKYMYMHDYFAI